MNSLVEVFSSSRNTQIVGDVYDSRIIHSEDQAAMQHDSHVGANKTNVNVRRPWRVGATRVRYAAGDEDYSRVPTPP